MDQNLDGNKDIIKKYKASNISNEIAEFKEFLNNADAGLASVASKCTSAINSCKEQEIQLLTTRKEMECALERLLTYHHILNKIESKFKEQDISKEETENIIFQSSLE